MDQYSGKFVMSKKNIKIDKRLLTCPLCKNLYKDATTINVCLDTFCKDCINRKLEEDNSNCCPDCKADLGSSLLETLRPDFHYSTLVSKSFQKEKSARREDISMTQQLSRANCKVTKRGASGTINAPQNPVSVQETTAKAHDDNAVGEKNYDVDQTRSPQSSNSITSKMQNKKRAIHHSGDAFDFTNKDTVLTKRNRNTRRRPRQHWKGDEEIESSNIMPEFPKLGPDCIERSIDAGGHGNKEELSEQFSNPLWFCLLACGHKTGNKLLPQIPKQYIKIKNGNMPVSYINKYLVHKLNLQHESEVEVMCYGEPLIPSLTLNELMSIWMQAKFGSGEVNLNLDEGIPDEEDFVMQLTYRSSKEH